MANFLYRVFSSGEFMPHGHCYLWNPQLVWLHLISDALIAASYMTIPVTLIYIIRKRQDIPFSFVFWAFGLFIVSCGLTHVMEIWTLWNATYWAAGLLKAFTALASVVTAVVLVGLVPQLLKIPNRTEFERARDLLAVSESRFRVASEGMKDSFYILESVAQEGKVNDFRFLEINAVELARLERPRQEIVGRLFSQILTGCRAEVLKERFLIVVAEGKPFDDIVEVRDDALPAQWLQLRVVPLHDGLAVTCLDITEIRRLEAERESHITVVNNMSVALKQSLREKEVLLMEVHHRVKNNLQVISSLLKLHADQIDDPAAAAAFQDSQVRVRSIALLHEQLYQSKSLADVDLAAYAADLVQTLLRANSRGYVELTIAASGISLPMDAAVPFGLILNEFVTNSLKHGFANMNDRTPALTIRVESVEDHLELVVADNGPGLPEGFDPLETKSLGMHLILALSGQLDGTVTFTSDQGTRSRLVFPKPGGGH